MILNEIAEKSEVMIEIDAEKVPIKQEVRTLTDILGVDVFSLTCEGRVIMTIEETKARQTVKNLRDAGYKEARTIGEVKRETPGYVIMKTLSGGKRIVRKPTGEIVPRIC